MPWHALYVKSRTEKKVGELLQLKGIEVYVPLVKTMRVWSDRKKMVEMPLLNGYVFINSNPASHETVVQTRGVVSFVKSEGKIATIREVEIDSLKQLVALGYNIEVSPLERNYKTGDRVKISAGALKGIEGIITGKGTNQQLELALESIGQCIKVKLPQELLLPVN